MIDRHLAIFAMLSTVCLWAQEMPKPANAEQEIRVLEMLRLKSLNRTDQWSGNVAKGALFHLGNGVVLNKEELLARLHDEVIEDLPEMSATKFSQVGSDVAIFSYMFRRSRYDDANVIVRQHLRRTLVYQHAASGWQMISSAISVIPYADLESKQVDTKILESYVGVWTDMPAPATVTLTREGSKLMAQGSNDAEKTELLALSDDTFVIRGSSDVITFEKGPDGSVTRSLWHDLGGSVEVHERSETGKP